MTARHRHLVLVIGCGLLFVLLFPLLNIVTHPISVLSNSDYEPLINRLPYFPYSFCWPVSLYAVPVLIVALVVLMQSCHFRFARSIIVLLAPFLGALTIQWFIAVQVDKYLWMSRHGYGFPWGIVFQFPFMLHCFWLALIWVVVCSALYGIAMLVRGKLSIRCSQPLGAERPAAADLHRYAAMISFIIPAHNEELWIGKCLGSIRTAMATIPEPYEVIVVDDASTDSTPRIAEQMGARTIRVEHRKISAVRNAGARTSSGEEYLFVDADTQVNEQAVRAALSVLRSGAAGGACVFEFDGVIPLWGRILHRFGTTMGRLFRIGGGCFLFCTRQAYMAAGGFSEDLRAGEDLGFMLALKKVGRFVVPKPTVITSGRKLSVVGPWEVVLLLVRVALRGSRYENGKTLDFMYGRRAQECRKPAQTGKTA